MHAKSTNPLSSLLRELTYIFLAASLAISGLAAALPQPVQAAPDAPTSNVGDMSSPRVRHTATLLPNGKVLALGGHNNAGTLGSAELYDMTTGAWSATGGVNPAREGHTATTLANGKVLAAGGSSGTSALNNTALYDPAKGAWNAAAGMATARFDHTATLLRNRQVLVAGGQNFNGDPQAAAELYNPATNTWSSAGTLAAPRWDHTATLLPGGWVLVAGGQNGNDVLDSAELYNPTTNAWTPVTAHLSTARLGHSATVLPDGRVLIVGGENNGGAPALDSAELFSFNSADPAASTWMTTGALTVNSRTGHSATLLPNGKVMVAGGFGGDIGNPGAVAHPLTSIELYTPASGEWSGGDNLQGPRRGHTATLLPTGEVLVAGGQEGDNYLSGVEKIDLATGNWTLTDEMDTERSEHSATLLADGKVLVTGGTDKNGVMLDLVEIYNPGSGLWTPANSMGTPRASHTATLLPNGKLLVAGGGDGTTFLSSAELYDPQTGGWEFTGGMHQARGNHTATLLRNGQVLVAGGLASNQYLTGAELYNPETGTWSLVTPLKNARKNHTATLLTDGTVLVTGGLGTIGYLGSSERYDVGLNDWLPTGGMTAPRGSHSATLLPNGQVLVAGGLNNSSPEPWPKTSELYDPLSGGWATTTGVMNSEHYFHSAALLPNGKVLVAGGADKTGSATQKCEVFDPTTARWLPVSPMNTPRQSFTSTLLPDGKLLAVGGFSDIFLKSAELFDLGQGIDPAWRPTITAIPPRIKVERMLTFSGTNLRGYQWIEASSGSTHESPSNYPLVQVRRPDSGQVAWLPPDPKLGFSDTAFNSAPVVFPIGPAIVTVYVNGIPSQSVMIQIDQIKTFVPLLWRSH